LKRYTAKHSEPSILPGENCLYIPKGMQWFETIAVRKKEFGKISGMVSFEAPGILLNGPMGDIWPVVRTGKFLKN